MSPLGGLSPRDIDNVLPNLPGRISAEDAGEPGEVGSAGGVEGGVNPIDGPLVTIYF